MDSPPPYPSQTYYDPPPSDDYPPPDDSPPAPPPSNPDDPPPLAPPPSNPDDPPPLAPPPSNPDDPPPLAPPPSNPDDPPPLAPPPSNPDDPPPLAPPPSNPDDPPPLAPPPTSFDPPPPPPPYPSPTSFNTPPTAPLPYQISLDPPPPTTPSPAVSTGLIVGSVIASVFALAVVVGIIFYVRVYKKKYKKEQPDISVDNKKVVSSVANVGLKPFSYEELDSATNNFSTGNFVGKGGFSEVYRGILTSEEKIAVKRLKAQGDQGDKEFQAEVEVISRVHHKHLVSLVGYCITSSERMLVYEYVANNSLDYHLHGKDGSTINWSTRLKIAIGSAKGLAYLHEDCHPKIIHRDVKAANILLDSNFEAKVADFGLAKLIPEIESYVMQTSVMGSHGYIAPECYNTGKVTYKSDVYSYGVLLLELITGRRAWSPGEYGYLVTWAEPLLKLAKEKGDYSLWVDQRLYMVYDRTEMARMITCAAACLQRCSEKRPLMSQIVRDLEGGDDSAMYQIALASTTDDDVTGSSDWSSSYDTTQRTEDRKKHLKTVFSSKV